MRNPRLTIRDAVREARACGIRVTRSKDGHFQFWINGQVVSQNGRRKDIVSPKLAVAIRRMNGTDAQDSHVPAHSGHRSG